MRDARTTGAHAFDAWHPAVPALLLAGILALTMLAVQPVVTLLSLAGALAFSVLARGARATLRGLRWQLPLLALVCLANPLFSASGSTLVARLGTRAIYLESLAFGATMGALMVASVVWMECAAQVLTQDRLLALAGSRAHTTALVTSMAAALVPQLVRRSSEVGDALAACTASGERPGVRDAARRTTGMLMTWALEDSLERADSMRARGWESGAERTSFLPVRLRARDAVALVALGAALALCALLAWAAASQWRFYPTMPRLRAWWGYVPLALLMLAPSAAELCDRVRWEALA